MTDPTHSRSLLRRAAAAWERRDRYHHRDGTPDVGALVRSLSRVDARNMARAVAAASALFGGSLTVAWMWALVFADISEGSRAAVAVLWIFPVSPLVTITLSLAHFLVFTVWDQLGPSEGVRAVAAPAAAEAIAAGGRTRATLLVGLSRHLGVDDAMATLKHMDGCRELLEGRSETALMSGGDLLVLTAYERGELHPREAVTLVELLSSPLGRAVQRIAQNSQSSASIFACGSAISVIRRLEELCRTAERGGGDVVAVVVALSRSVWACRLSPEELLVTAEEVAGRLGDDGIEILVGMLPDWDGTIVEAIDMAGLVAAT